MVPTKLLARKGVNSQQAEAPQKAPCRKEPAGSSTEASTGGAEGSCGLHPAQAAHPVVVGWEVEGVLVA